MIPYSKLLSCLFIEHNDAYAVISAKLRGYGITIDEITLARFREVFLSKVPSSYKTHFSSSTQFVLHPLIFDMVAVSTGIDSYFNNSGKLDLSRFEKILKNKLIQRHIECSFIGKLPAMQIIEDISSTYDIDIEHDIIESYRSLMIDLSQCRHQEDWIRYMKTIPRDECLFRNMIILKPSDYVRWKLGVSVQIDPNVAMQEMATDMFYKYKESLSDPTLAGLDVTRKIADLAFKAVDRVAKFKEINKTPNKANSFNALVLSFEDPKETTIMDIAADS